MYLGSIRWALNVQNQLSSEPLSQWRLWPYPVQTSWSKRSPILVRKLFWSWPCWWWAEPRPSRTGWETLFHKLRRWCPPDLLQCRTVAALGQRPPAVHRGTTEKQILWHDIMTNIRAHISQIEQEPSLPVCIYECARRPVCHRSLIPLRCLLNQPRLLLQTPRAHWSAWCLYPPLGFPSGSASQEPWPRSLHNNKVNQCKSSKVSLISSLRRSHTLQRHVWYSHPSTEKQLSVWKPEKGSYTSLAFYLVGHWASTQRRWWCSQPSTWPPGPHLPANHLPLCAQCDRTVTRQPVRSSWWPHEETGTVGTHTAPPSPTPSDTNTRSECPPPVCAWVCPSSRTSSGTALMLVKPFLKHTNTRLAPQRRAEVAQSKAVSPAPKTITTPLNSGREERQRHMPGHI